VDSKAFTADEVRTWLDGVQSDLRTIGHKMAPLIEEQRRLEEREELLRDLLKSFERSAVSSDRGEEPAIPAESGAVGQYVVARAVEILREAGEPLHINDLHARFLANGHTIPGAGAPANLIVHLRKAPEIASPQRGLYGLTEDIGPTKPRRARKRTTTRRRRKG
jgi:cell division septum initiation protein DivIVA